MGVMEVTWMTEKKKKGEKEEKEGKKEKKFLRAHGPNEGSTRGPRGPEKCITL